MFAGNTLHYMAGVERQVMSEKNKTGARAKMITYGLAVTVTYKLQVLKSFMTYRRAARCKSLSAQTPFPSALWNNKKKMSFFFFFSFAAATKDFRKNNLWVSSDGGF